MSKGRLKVDTRDLRTLSEIIGGAIGDSQAMARDMLDRCCCVQDTESPEDPYLRLDFPDNKGGYFMFTINEVGIAVTYFPEEADGQKVLSWEWKRPKTGI